MIYDALQFLAANPYETIMVCCLILIVPALMGWW